jgi:hypothetical protein
MFPGAGCTERNILIEFWMAAAEAKGKMQLAFETVDISL